MQQQAKLHWEKCKREEVIFLFFFFFNPKYFSTHKFYIQLLVIQIFFPHKLCLSDTLKGAAVSIAVRLGYTSENQTFLLGLANFMHLFQCVIKVYCKHSFFFFIFRSLCYCDSVSVCVCHCMCCLCVTHYCVCVCVFFFFFFFFFSPPLCVCVTVMCLMFAVQVFFFFWYSSPLCVSLCVSLCMCVCVFFF